MKTLENRTNLGITPLQCKKCGKIVWSEMCFCCHGMDFAGFMTEYGWQLISDESLGYKSLDKGLEALCPKCLNNPK